MRAMAVATAGLLLLATLVSLVSPAVAAPVPTHADLQTERRRSAVLESEVALAATRKPYLVLDLQAKALRYRLMGMTMREIAVPEMSVEGLVASDGAADAPALAGIFTLREKEGDPRLKPLSPEQVEAGADDENAANVLPPEPPKEYRLMFKQPIALEVVGHPEAQGVGGAWSRFTGFVRRLRGPRGDEDDRLRIALHLDPQSAAEVYRSLIPEVRLLIVPPPGLILPPAGQEAPPKPRAPRPAPPPKPAEPKEVPFAIPPPVDENGASPAERLPDATQDAVPPPPPPPPPGNTKPPGRSGAGSGGAA
jgi:hypothetical protein